MNSNSIQIRIHKQLPGIQNVPSRPKLLQNDTLHKNCFGTINFAIVTKQSLYKVNSFACSPANRDKPVAATLQRKCLGGIIFVIITKITTKENVPKNSFVIILARMVVAFQVQMQNRNAVAAQLTTSPFLAQSESLDRNLESKSRIAARHSAFWHATPYIAAIHLSISVTPKVQVILVSQVILIDPPEIPFKTSMKIAPRGYF